MKKNNLAHIAYPTLFSLMCIGTIFFCSSLFVETKILPKWYYAKLLSCLFLIFHFSRFFCFNKRKAGFEIAPAVFTVISASCFVLAIKGLFQFFNIQPLFSGNNVVGWYDNSAGISATLCAGLPFSFFKHKNYLLKWLAILSIGASSLTIIFSSSRAGIFSLFVILIIYIYQYYGIKKRSLILSSVILFFILSVSLYFMKKKSAEGRLLVWKCCFSMIEDRPILGFGSGGFKKNYMNYQSNYFKIHKDSKYEMIADNVNYPYNEYISLIIQYGVFGFLILVVLIFFLWKSYCRNKQDDSFIAGLCLISIATFSLFSYPFSYPFIWVLCGISIYIVISNAKYLIHCSMFYNRLVYALIILLTIFWGWNISHKMLVEMEWSKIANEAKHNKLKLAEVIPKYKYLYSTLFNNPQFLYNYAAVLNYNKDYERSLFIANECKKLSANYDLEMLSANNLFELNQYHRERSVISKPLICVHQNFFHFIN